MIYLAGSNESFRCRCGCNVFTVTMEREGDHLGEFLTQYRCNGCGLKYESEK
jgi:hypothetical protein